MSNLQGKTAVVTGGSSGIGYATAMKFKELGANVVITGRRKEAVDQAATTLGVTGLVADQANLLDIDTLTGEVKEIFGSVDVLFINAGVASFAPVESMTEDQFDSMMNVNFKGAFFTLQKFLSILNDGSCVINLSSINAYTAMPNSAVYAASKAALNSFTKTAAYELAPRHIRVNSVNPGPIDTPIYGKLGMPAEAITEFVAAMQDRIPLKRFGAAEEIANLVAFLVSDEASFITGAEYNIDGGINLNPILQ